MYNIISNNRLYTRRTTCTKVFGQNHNNDCENAAFQLKEPITLVIEAAAQPFQNNLNKTILTADLKNISKTIRTKSLRFQSLFIIQVDICCACTPIIFTENQDGLDFIFRKLIINILTIQITFLTRFSTKSGPAITFNQRRRQFTPVAALVSPVAKLRIQHTRDIVNYDLTFTCSHTCAKCISSLIPDFENFLILPFKHIILSHTAILFG